MQRETYRFKITNTTPPSGVENATLLTLFIFSIVIPILILPGGTYLFKKSLINNNL